MDWIAREQRQPSLLDLCVQQVYAMPSTCRAPAQKTTLGGDSRSRSSPAGDQETPPLSNNMLKGPSDRHLHTKKTIAYCTYYLRRKDEAAQSISQVNWYLEQLGHNLSNGCRHSHAIETNDER
jgi:hypothetical protein